MLPRRLDSQRIAHRLAELNLTMDDFKNGFGRDRRTIERLLSGKTQNAQVETVSRIAQFLGLQPHDILLGAAAGGGARAASGLMSAPYIQLPTTGAYLEGRDQEIQWLDDIWVARQVQVCSIVAWGGVGKSTLVSHWVGRLARDGWRGAERVFGWTFYKQGIHEGWGAADTFLEAALRYFGAPEPSQETPQEKGYRLARLVGSTRTLLILDGLEPLQAPPGPDAGKLQDEALATLLRTLALENAGLCLLTTRLAVADIAAFQSTTAPVLALDPLSEEAGARFLYALGVQGAVAERREVVREYGGHTLSLHLLGTYLRDACGGDILRRHDIAWGEEWSEPGGQAWRIMASYERWLGQGPEVAILRLLGLFDRTATATEIAALRAAPAIPGLTETLSSITERQWVQALRRLRTAGLLAPVDLRMPHHLDTHPLIRAYYRHTLREHAPAAWRAGHDRLYQYLQDSVLETYPDTLVALAPLYAAVAHGCLAGRAAEVLQVFRQRIRRGAQRFSIEHLGAFGTDLAALAHFFAVPWSTIVPGLSVDEQLFLWQATGECLSALGRSYDAETPFQAALALAERQADWTSATAAATRLSEVYRARGDLRTALSFARRSAAYADRPGVPLPMQLLSQTFFGFALYWAGHSAAAETVFRCAEAIQGRLNPHRPRLHGVPGYMYSELLLDHLEAQADQLTLAQFQQAWEALHERMTQALAFAEVDAVLCDVGLQHISLGRLYSLSWQRHKAMPGACRRSMCWRYSAGIPSESTPTDDIASLLAQAVAHVEQAVLYLQQANHRNYIPRALLTRAALSRLQHHFTRAHDDLQTVLEMAQHSPLDFYQADAYLEQAVLHLAIYHTSQRENDRQAATASLHQARALIQEMGYARRDRQVRKLEVLLARQEECV